jgi:putative hydrolase of the HAD superfamily
MRPTPSRIDAVFFDIDFTLIYPGPTFQGAGYQRFCAAHGIQVDPARFPDAVRAASWMLNEQQEHAYDADIFVRYTRCIIEGMGGTGSSLDACAREIYDEWAACQHFELYDDVRPVLQALVRRGVKIGLISNSHRHLPDFETHFGFRGLIAAAVSSADHGFLKPHPSIFESALRLAGVRAEASLMVGDSLPHDIDGARGVGMRGVLIHRSADPVSAPSDVVVIRHLGELLGLLGARHAGGLEPEKESDQE